MLKRGMLRSVSLTCFQSIHQAGYFQKDIEGTTVLAGKY